MQIVFSTENIAKIRQKPLNKNWHGFGGMDDAFSENVIHGIAVCFVDGENVATFTNIAPI